MAELIKPKAILFDWDNTLVDSWPIIHQALHHTFIDMGHTPWTLEETKKRVGKSMRDAFPALFGDRWKEAGKLYRQYYGEIHLDHITPYPHAEDLLRRLQEQEIYLAVVSNKTGNFLRQEAEYLGWTDLFSALVGAADASHDKPHPAPVYLALKTGMIEANKDVWFVGDSEVDLEAAQVAGLVPVLYGDVQPDSDKPNHYCGFRFDQHYRNHEESLKALSDLKVA